MKKIFCGILAALLTLTLTACVGSNSIQKKDAPYPVTVGNATVLEQPERVATLSAQFTNILRDLGYGETLVAVSAEEAVLEENTGLTAIGTALAPDLAAIKEAAPDVLFTSSPMASAQLDELWEAGVQVIVLSPITSLDTLYDRYYDVIAAMDGKAEANTAGVALTDAMKGDVERLLAKLPDEKASFVLVCTLDPYVATPDTLEGNLLALLGENAVSGENYTAEGALAETTADILFYASPLEAGSITASDTLSGISANIHPLDRALLTSGTKDVIEQLRAIASLMYPDIDFTDTAVETGSDEASEASGEAEAGESSDTAEASSEE